MKKSTKEIFIEKVMKLYNNLYDYSNVHYINNKTKVEIKCTKCKTIFFQSPNNHLNFHGCPFCAKINRTKLNTFDTKIFIKKANIKYNNKYNYENSIYINSKTKIEIICNKHGVFSQKPSDHLSGRGCYKCGLESKKRRKTLFDFIKNANIIHNDYYDYSLVEYEKSNIKVKIVCKTHGIFHQTPNNHLNGAGCPKCNESKGEKAIRNFFEKNNINYIREKTFEKCKNKELLYFDFYLPKHNTLIEYDGELHCKSVNFFGGDYGLNYRKNNDNIKNNFAITNNIKLLRIRYDEFKKINTILQDIINN